ncbi:alanine racemase [Vallitalea longa]|uniref:Alanine racemase n=1 Tax=Vallitalea longa TaxID=2936439 RepID=A0A9W6DI47_9FIRM|nr:alanine racemase [Vallitalea longa]GKX32252.1 alanine racemase [Vallitalea longa]
MKIDTPKVIIDYDIMKNNIHKMQELVSNNSCSLRPHIKTHKIPDIAKMQIEAGAVGISVAKIGEAEVMADAGIDDIFIAYPIIGEDKIKRLLKLNKKIRLIVGTESIYAIKQLDKYAKEDNQILELRVEIDTGMGRSGVEYQKVESFFDNIAGFSNINITGIFTFKGLIYNGEVTRDAKNAGYEESNMMVDLANRLRKKGFDIKDISVGSTPTAKYACMVEGVTEVRPGTYVFNDQMLVNLNVCEEKDCAARVLSTIVSKQKFGKAIIDGGNKTFSTDASMDKFPYFLKGYGKVVGYDNITLSGLSEEHGTILIDNDNGELSIGDTISIIPNHVCTTINLHNELAFVSNNNIIDKKMVSARGMVY